MKKLIGGTHYKDLSIEPIDVIQVLFPEFPLGNIIKYIARNKNNKKEDLEKAKSYAYIKLNPTKDFVINIPEIQKSWGISDNLTEVLSILVHNSNYLSDSNLNTIIALLDKELEEMP